MAQKKTILIIDDHSLFREGLRSLLEDQEDIARQVERSLLRVDHEVMVAKDGPSAGVTIATALVSAFTGMPVRNDVAMTGEITLRGRVLPIGGLKEKSLGAIRSGIKTIIIPSKNTKDLVEIPKTVRRKVKYISVERMDEVLSIALEAALRSVRERKKAGSAVTSRRR